MSPFQHGEVYVTDDGAETDLDLGHYERFTSTRTTKSHNWTAGKIYESIIRKERKGEFLGKTVQVIPHVTDEIKSAFRAVSERQRHRHRRDRRDGGRHRKPALSRSHPPDAARASDRKMSLFVHLTLVPYISTSGELKTKPTQHSVKELRAIGIQPDILLCRTDRSLTPDIKSKISLFTNVPVEAVITAKDVDNIYEIPLIFAAEGLDTIILKKLGLPPRRRHLAPWKALVTRMKNPRDEVTIALVGKYAGLQDSYLSLEAALDHGGVAHRLKVNICWIEAENLEKGRLEQVLGRQGRDPGARRVRASAASRARSGRSPMPGRKKSPIFGICLGMQCATIEFARNVAGLQQANSTEFDADTPHRIFFLWRELKPRARPGRDDALRRIRLPAGEEALLPTKPIGKL